MTEKSQRAPATSNCFSNQGDLLAAIRSMHLGGEQFQADVTYGAGALHCGLRPEICFDLAPKFPFVQAADVRCLPLRSGAMASVIFDPPFLAGGGKNSRMHKQYSSLASVPALYRFYTDALAELHRILGHGGILVFKCQDITNGRTQGFSHCEIYNAATQFSFYALDLFLLIAPHRMRPYGMQRQFHARKHNCYFWVFRKSSRRNYRAAPSGRESGIR